MRKLSALLALLVIVAMFATATTLANGPAVPQSRDPAITVSVLDEVMSLGLNISAATEATIAQYQLMVSKANCNGVMANPIPEATARNGAISSLMNNATTITAHADNGNFDNTA
jgi:hypothetical protein